MVNIIKQHVMRLFTPIVKVPLFSFMGGQFVSYYDIGCRIKVIVMVSFPWVLINFCIWNQLQKLPPPQKKIQKFSITWKWGGGSVLKHLWMKCLLSVHQLKNKNSVYIYIFWHLEYQEYDTIYPELGTVSDRTQLGVCTENSWIPVDFPLSVDNWLFDRE